MAVLYSTKTTPIWLLLGFIHLVTLNPSAAKISKLSQVGVFSSHDLDEEFANAEPSVVSQKKANALLDDDDSDIKQTDGNRDGPGAPKPTNAPPSSLLHHLAINIIAFATVIVPGYLIRARYSARRGTIYDETGFWSALQRFCFAERQDISTAHLQNSSSAAKSGGFWSRMPRWLQFVICFLGLQILFLRWGFLQEKFLTRPYDGERFEDSQFLVFMNRVMALLFSGTYMFVTWKRQPVLRVPFYKFSFASFSNVMSSWFQYEALKYVSFPTQVLAKASKIIPVMLMGKVVSGKVYPLGQYLSAGLITVGMSIFLYSRWDGNTSNSNLISSALGTAVLVGYIVFDSFTSTWQEQLKKESKKDGHAGLTSMQMMYGINFFSVILAGISLIEQGGFVSSFQFAFRHPDFFRDVLVSSLCQTVGQLFIYTTIGLFGAAVFTTIMTVRQAIAVPLSCFFFGHVVPPVGVFGVVLVFIALFYEGYAAWRGLRPKGGS